MPRQWLLLDMSYLAWRAQYTTGSLQYKGRPTGVLYGLLREIRSLQERFQNYYMAFAFDSRHNIRIDKYPFYKESRNCVDEAFQKTRQDVRAQLTQMRRFILPFLGYKNVFQQRGYEGDDIIASMVRNMDERESAVLISNDEDLYQLLSLNVSICKPVTKGIFDLREFRHQYYNIQPQDWPRVKAIAGCTTDDIDGVTGVGDKTASKWIHGGIKKESETHLAISKFVKSPEYKINLELVTLPLDGCKDFKVKTHPASTEKQWQMVLDELGIRTLSDSVDPNRHYRKAVSE